MSSISVIISVTLRTFVTTINGDTMKTHSEHSNTYSKSLFLGRHRRRDRTWFVRRHPHSPPTHHHSHRLTDTSRPTTPCSVHSSGSSELSPSGSDDLRRHGSTPCTPRGPSLCSTTCSVVVHRPMHPSTIQSQSSQPANPDRQDLTLPPSLLASCHGDELNGMFLVRVGSDLLQHLCASAKSASRPSQFVQHALLRSDPCRTT